MAFETLQSSRPLPVMPVDGPPSDNGHPPGKSFLWLWLLMGCVAVGLLVYFVVLPRFLKAGAAAIAAAGQGARGIPVVTAVSHQGDMDLYLNGLGSVTALNTVTIHSRVDGELVKVAYSEGQVVKEGQLLAQIDPRPYQAQLAQAQGQLLKDQAALQNAQTDLKRYKDLYAQGVSVTQQQVDTQQALVTQNQGAVKTDEGQVANATLQVGYCNITAPLAGRIGLRLVDQGNLVHASDPNGLLVITQLQPISVVFTIPQDSISRVQNKLAAGNGLVVDAYDTDLKKKLATGKLVAIDNQVDQNTLTVRMKAQYQNENYALFPNEFVNARLLVDTLHDAVIVPAAAVQRGPDANFVYVVKSDQTVEMKNVVTGPAEADDIVIKSGLAPGEVVVTDGVDKLQQGAKVTTRARKAGDNGATTRPAGAVATSQPGKGRRSRNNGEGEAATLDAGNATTRPSPGPNTQPGGGAQ
jgi:multidrug efflux system membrane fusion protein